VDAVQRPHAVGPVPGQRDAVAPGQVVPVLRVYGVPTSKPEA
jgi:hypothetical protein